MTCKDCFYNDQIHCLIDDGKEFFPEERVCFKDKLAIIEIPSILGDTVYVVDNILGVICGKVSSFLLEDGKLRIRISFERLVDMTCWASDFGKTVFLTEEEAKKRQRSSIT